MNMTEVVQKMHNLNAEDIGVDILDAFQLPHTPEVIIESDEMLAYFANETTRLSLKVVNADSRFSYAFATFQNGIDQIHRSRETLNFDELLEDFKVNIHEYIENGNQLPPRVDIDDLEMDEPIL